MFADPVIIGLTGGIASGKSAVAELLERLGSKVIDADRISHEILENEKVKRQIREIWGEKVFDGGDVNRSLLARIVFDPADNREQLTRLEDITHPRIRSRILDEIESASDSRYTAIVLDVPLLFESGWDDVCDQTIFVDACDSVREKRALARGWTRQEWLDRESQQMPIVDKKRKSSSIIDNSTDLETTFQQIKSLWIRWGLVVPADFND